MGAAIGSFFVAIPGADVVVEHAETVSIAVSKIDILLLPGMLKIFEDFWDHIFQINCGQAWPCAFGAIAVNPDRGAASFKY